MGIPHLITYLRPFAATVVFTGQNAIIDGPALAYHVWHICLASQSQCRNAFESIPSYELIQETLIKWLDELQKRGVFIQKIFFDGFLPPSKRDTRLGRIRRYTRQLTDYNQAWPQVFPFMYASHDSHKPPMNLFDIEPVTPCFTQLPAAPFLVPAVIESLLKSDRFQHLLDVIPGEADLYCAQYVKINGGTILTGDSDLLIHDLGQGAVTFLRDIELVGSGEQVFLRCIQYDPRAITQRLCLPDPYGLRALAFEMKMDGYGTFRELVRRAVNLQAISANEKLYRTFADEFVSSPSILRVQVPSNSKDVKQHLSLLRRCIQSLDPRISEFVLQFTTIAQLVGLPESLVYSFNDQNGVEVFLPFLLDCPLRTSAWEISTSTRQLAYGLLNLVLPREERIEFVTEYRRLQNGTQGRELQVPTNEQIPEACMALADLFKKLRNSTSETDLWLAVAIYQEVSYSSSLGKASLCNTIMTRQKRSSTTKYRLTWDGVHMFAQVQGSYYSFRMLSQILELALLYGNFETLPVPLRQLQVDLKSLPPLEALPSVADGIKELGSPDNQEILAVVCKLLEIQDEEDLDAKPTIKKDKGKRRRSKTGKEQMSQRKKTNNMFEVLDAS